MEGLQQLRPTAWGKEKVHGFGLNPKYPIILFGGIQKPAKKKRIGFTTLIHIVFDHPYVLGKSLPWIILTKSVNMNEQTSFFSWHKFNN